MLQLPGGLPRRLALFSLSLFFVLAGANHFLNPDFYLQMMPPYLPAHLELVYLSGFLEALGGAAVLAPRVRAHSGWALILLLIAVFPANLYMALNPSLFPEFDAMALYIRLPLQIPMIAWAYWATRPDRAASDTAAVAA